MARGDERIRLTITVSPEVHEVFSRMAETAGVSLGRCMGDWLADTLDGAQFVALKMEQARQSPKLAMRELEATARGHLEEVRSGMDRLRATGWGAGSGGAGASAPALPPSSNTGGKSPRRGGKR
jgi:hypothetical protein